MEIIMENIPLVVIGVVLLIVGIVNMTGNISTVHSYNRKKVKEEDVPKYGRAVGAGSALIGLGLIAAFVLYLLKLPTAAPYVIP